MNVHSHRRRSWRNCVGALEPFRRPFRWVRAWTAAIEVQNGLATARIAMSATPLGISRKTSQLSYKVHAVRAVQSRGSNAYNSRKAPR
jgi:hypothetical protein